MVHLFAVITPSVYRNIDTFFQLKVKLANADVVHCRNARRTGKRLKISTYLPTIGNFGEAQGGI